MTTTTHVHGFNVTTWCDDNAESPREWGNASRMVCWHRRYNLGDAHNFSTPDDFREWWEENGTGGVRLPLYLYDHSGITISTSPFSCRWDSGQVGYIYMTAEKMREEYAAYYPPEEWEGRARERLEAEVQTYDTYLRGEVYGFTIKTPEGDVVDTCGGFFSEREALEAGAKIAKHEEKQALPLLAHAGLLN